MFSELSGVDVAEPRDLRRCTHSLPSPSPGASVYKTLLEGTGLLASLLDKLEAQELA